ncbi:MULTISPECIES: hypothetical protein [Salinibaculum]|uniref:hypothetical protein n=1 Tax=Salinibaculum TaxID=2732368 RepID=UPI0030D15A1B
MDRPPMPKSMQEIETAIRTICSGERPFATASDIAEVTGYSKQTVLNNADGVVYRFDEIRKATVGQANVYYVKHNRLDEFEGENTISAHDLRDADGDARYVTIEEAPEDSQFDLEAHWYDWQANEMSGYHPSSEEIGRPAAAYATKPDAIKYWDEEEVEFEDELLEESKEDSE